MCAVILESDAEIEPIPNGGHGHVYDQGTRACGSRDANAITQTILSKRPGFLSGLGPSCFRLPRNGPQHPASPAARRAGTRGL